MKLIGNDFAKH